jgi:hypothetical protein
LPSEHDPEWTSRLLDVTDQGSRYPREHASVYSAENPAIGALPGGREPQRHHSMSPSMSRANDLATVGCKMAVAESVLSMTRDRLAYGQAATTHSRTAVRCPFCDRQECPPADGSRFLEPRPPAYRCSAAPCRGPAGRTLRRVAVALREGPTAHLVRRPSSVPRLLGPSRRSSEHHVRSWPASWGASSGATASLGAPDSRPGSSTEPVACDRRRAARRPAAWPPAYLRLAL